MRPSTPLCILTVIVTSCVSYDTAAPGIDDRESKVLSKVTYWTTDKGRPTPDCIDLDKLFAKSLNDSLDGEYSEMYSTALPVSLAAVGDSEFSSVLSMQPFKVQKDVARRLSSYLSIDGLDYPATQARVNAIKQKQAEQAAAPDR